MTVAALLGILPVGMKATGQALFNGKNLLNSSIEEITEITEITYLHDFPRCSKQF